MRQQRLPGLAGLAEEERLDQRQVTGSLSSAAGLASQSSSITDVAPDIRPHYQAQPEATAGTAVPPLQGIHHSSLENGLLRDMRLTLK